MALWAIGDLHLSFGADKPMDVFGGAWDGYVDKLCEGLSCIGPEDTTVLLGDLSWALDLGRAEADFRFIHEHIPGRKIIIKGNHDYWWSTAKKFDAFCQEYGFENMQVMNNNCFFYEGAALCGTRGWFYDLDNGHNEKIFRRELIRLETSLKAAGEAEEKICFLHYPPVYRGYRCPEIQQLLAIYGVKLCYYGHLHADSHKLAIEGVVDGVEYHLAAADYTGFTPIRLK
ncbi:MAG: serine/threonine protein phosphatase [Ruminococcaceae bacterium]|nr:serine/threonine protein phosphatase [Oscillospiraceae bacterium]